MRLTPLTVGFHEIQFLSALNAENQETLTPDSMAPTAPQALNRYAYCLNNPLRYIDPTGHETVRRQRLTLEAWHKYKASIDRYIETQLERRARLGGYIGGISMPVVGGILGGAATFAATKNPVGGALGAIGGAALAGVLGWGFGKQLGYELGGGEAIEELEGLMSWVEEAITWLEDDYGPITLASVEGEDGQICFWIEYGPDNETYVNPSGEMSYSVHKVDPRELMEILNYNAEVTYDFESSFGLDN
jgi:hypothetical protein